MTGYDLKYQSDFYNFFHKLVSVKIYKKDYGVHSVIRLRSTEVIIEVNYIDEDTPIIGTGAKINIINEENFSYLNDLLTSYEKQFYCTIEYDGVLVFQGWSLCDLNEQQFLQWARITIQFVDYLHRLEDNKSGLLSSIKDNVSVLGIVSGALKSLILSDIGFGDTLPVYVNSTLFETTMEDASDGTTTAFEQAFVESNAFYVDSEEYQDTFTVINKILLPLGAYLYSYGNKWIIERKEDAAKNGSWVLYPDVVFNITNGQSTPSLKQEYNKQDSIGFDYKDTSQLINYLSGLQKLEVALNDKPLESYVFNDFDSTNNFTPYARQQPLPGELDFRKWYYYNLGSIIKVGKDYHDINTYVEWSYPDALKADGTDGALYYGLYYSFEVQFNTTENTPTDLDVIFKMIGTFPLFAMKTHNEVTTRFGLIVDGTGTYAGCHLYIDPTSGRTTINHYRGLNHTSFQVDFQNSGNNKVWTTNQSISLTEKGITYIDAAVNVHNYNDQSIWTFLGSPGNQRFIVCFFPLRYKYIATASAWDLLPHSPPPTMTMYDRNNYLGDIELTVNQADIKNKLTYYINKNFINTGSVNLDFWDLDNTNYCNGYRVGTLGVNKTKLWTSDLSSVPQSLVDIFAKDRFRKYYHTIHTLKGTILYDGHMKPFSILTDDNLQDDSSQDIRLLLTSYIWDLNNGTYDIEAEEYDFDENIVIDLSEEDPEPPSSSTIVLTQIPGGVYVEWAAVSNATGYRVERMPRWYIYDDLYQYWAYDWKVVYQGSGTSFGDNISDEGVPEPDTTYTYRMYSYDAYTTSPSSAEVSITCSL